MTAGLVGQAVGMFAVTNVDDLVLLALYFDRAGRDRGSVWRVVAGQYLGFCAILGASVAGALGAGLLPPHLLRYLGLVPLALGVLAAWRVWRERRGAATGSGPDGPAGALGVLPVAAVTFANGGDNIGVYVPVFAAAGTAGLVTYTAVFLALVAVWCAAGRYLATRPAVAGALARLGHLVLPAVLIGIGLLILFDR